MNHRRQRDQIRDLILALEPTSGGYAIEASNRWHHSRDINIEDRDKGHLLFRAKILRDTRVTRDVKSIEYVIEFLYRSFPGDITGILGLTDAETAAYMACDTIEETLCAHLPVSSVSSTVGETASPSDFLACTVSFSLSVTR